MAERRARRASSRLKTPTPQPQSAQTTPQAGRATRSRAMRSTSREADLARAAPRDRRATRQASAESVESASDESLHSSAKAAMSQLEGRKKAFADLETVEELDSQVVDEEAVQTPQRAVAEPVVPHRSPGAVSEMSGTTAISSFSMTEAELLDSRFILRHLPRLYQDSSNFLDHLVPRLGQMKDDFDHMVEMQKPESDYVADYNDFNDELARRLTHFRAEHQHYISPRAVHRALLGSNADAANLDSGLNLILYLANLVLLAKDMIHSDRNDKDIWTTLRQLDNQFPAPFAIDLNRSHSMTSSAAGTSALLLETFELALDLRTQLAILYLERESGEGSFDPDAALQEVFFDSQDPGDGEHGPPLRGWNITGLQAASSSHSLPFQDKIVERIQEVRQYFPTDEESIDHGESVDLESLSAIFPWSSVILRLLGWTRLRGAELYSCIDAQGGPNAIIELVEQVRQLQPTCNDAPVERASPVKKRSSLGKDRRRRSRHFDPNEDINTAVLDRLIAKEQAAMPRPTAPPPSLPTEVHDNIQVEEVFLERDSPPSFENGHQDQPPGQASAEDEVEIRAPSDAGVDNATVNGGTGLDDEGITLEAEDHEADVDETTIAAHVDMISEPTDGMQSTPISDEARSSNEDPTESVMKEAEAEAPAKPPQSTYEHLQLLKSRKRMGKENQVAGYFKRQENARRVEFEDGFDTQSQPISSVSLSQAGPSPSRAQLPKPNSPKRAQLFDDSSDEDLFVPQQRTDRVGELRAKAKRARTAKTVDTDDPAPSSAPPSYQVPEQTAPTVADQRSERSEQPQQAGEERTADQAPPPPTYSSQVALARENVRSNVRKPVQVRSSWTAEEEEAFMEYMAREPRGYSAILKMDMPPRGSGVLQDRTQVNLKDKARNMALNMIKSGSGLRPGFEDIISPASAIGRKLMEDGFEW